MLALVPLKKDSRDHIASRANAPASFASYTALSCDDWRILGNMRVKIVHVVTAVRALAAHFLLHALAGAETTITLTSTTTVLTSTTTVTRGGETDTTCTTCKASLSSTLTPATRSSNSIIIITPTTRIHNLPTATSLDDMSYQDGLEAAVLNSTNYYRSQHQASNLTWDSTLADYAQDYSKNCKWEHSVLGSQFRSVLTLEQFILTDRM